MVGWLLCGFLIGVVVTRIGWRDPDPPPKCLCQRVFEDKKINKDRRVN